MFEIIYKILKVFEENNLWNEGVELIGSWCFSLYQKHLGAKFYPLKTQDIDFLIPLPFKGNKHINLILELERLGFKHSFNSDGSIYLWNSELKIEFLTLEKGRGTEKAIKIEKLSVNAIPLRFMDILFIEPIFIKDNNINICVPNPSSYCLQKLIVSFRRKKEYKRIKDIEQAIHTYAITDKEKFKKIYFSLPKKWQIKAINNLKKSQGLLPLLEKNINEILFTLQNI